MAAENDWNDERHVWMVRASNGDAVGPVSVAQIAQAISFGKLRDVDDVRHVQAVHWEKVGPFMTRMRPPTQAQVDATGQIAIDSVPTSPPPSRGEVATSPGIVVRRWTLGGLFDFTFTTFFTTRIVALLYAAVLLLAAGYLLACAYFGVTTILRAVSASQETGEPPGTAIVVGVALVVAGPIGALIAVICGRVALEFIVVTFRISETLTEIKARTK